MSSKISLGIGIIIIASLFSCIHVENSFTGLPPGPWRGVLKLPLKETPTTIESVELKEFEEVLPYQELPFNFEVVYTSKDQFHVEIINGDERIKLDDITFALDKRISKDTLTINFPAYDTYLTGIFEENIIEGFWHVNYKENYKIPFIAYQGQDNRFRDPMVDPNIDITGDWNTTFDFNKEDPYKAIGVFNQKGKKLSGTFKTETGDYRFLDGSVFGDKLFLSCFDGAHAFLFTGKLIDKKEIVGKFYSGKHYESDWIAKPADANSMLGNPYELTESMSTEGIDFKFKNHLGQEVNLSDAKYGGKAKLVNIMGTWCPNCRDETNFLKEKYGELSDKNIEVLSICFERYKEEAKSLQAIGKYKKHLDVPWEMLHGGYADKKEAAKMVPFIEHVLSYPTLLFIDKDNKIQKIHTGFNGPATEEFAEFEKEFYETLNTIQ